MSNNKFPRHALWLDIETTGLSPKDDEILELAFILTDFAYPYRETARGHHLISGPGRLDLLEGRCSEFIQAMHAASGLTEALRDPNATTTLPSLRGLLLELSKDWPRDKDERVVIAGSSVGTFDLQFIRHHLPDFASRLSHRAFDVSAVKLAARSLGMPPSDEIVEPAHRALRDVETSIGLMRQYACWLAIPRGMEGKVCTTRWCAGEGDPHGGGCVDAAEVAHHANGDCLPGCSLCSPVTPSPLHPVIPS